MRAEETGCLWRALLAQRLLVHGLCQFQPDLHHKLWDP
jgi:hypothetical protein